MSRKGLALWCRQRGLAQVAAVQLLCLAWVVIGSGILVQVPPLLSGSGVEVANAAIVPLVTSVAIAWALARRDVALESARRRPVWWWDIAIALVLTASYLTVAPLLPASMTIVSFRNAVGLAGLSLLAAAVGLTQLSSALPIAYTAASLFGGHMEMRRALWSWPVKYARDPIAAALAGLTFLVGASLYLRRIPTVRNEDDD